LSAEHHGDGPINTRESPRRRGRMTGRRRAREGAPVASSAAADVGGNVFTARARHMEPPKPFTESSEEPLLPVR
jgi:hypothetical protein